MIDDSDDPAPDGSQRRNPPSKVKYMQMLQDVADRIRTDIVIDLNDLDAWEKTIPEADYKLIESIERNAYHYLEIFSRAVDAVMPQPSRDLRCGLRILLHKGRELTVTVSRTTC